MIAFEDEYQRYCARHGTPDRLELMLCDLNGILRGKWLPVDGVSKFDNGNVRLPISTCAPNILGEEVESSGLGIAVGDPDGILVPIEGSLKPASWLDGNVAQVLVDMQDLDGQPIELSPRQVLKSILQKFQQEGLTPVLATELEFYIVRKRENPEDAPQAPTGAPQAQNYDLEVLAEQQYILDDILEAAKAQNLPTDTLIAEFGRGQFEINFHHTSDALAAAETALLFKRLVRGVVRKHGMEATFMAKPFADMPGNGMHVHLSLVDLDGNNIFDSRSSDLNTPLGFAIAGLLETMREMQAIFAPHANSYRRFQRGSFAPSSPSWAFDNRAAAVRVPETRGPGARLEHRISGADVNPYLAIAAILAGVFSGLENEFQLPDALAIGAEDNTVQLFTDWQASVDHFAMSDFASETFGEFYRDIYVNIRRDEIAKLTSIISPMEYKYYLSRF